MKDRTTRICFAEIDDLVSEVASNKSVSRAEYREFLEEIQNLVEASLEALKDDERREKREAEDDGQ